MTHKNRLLIEILDIKRKDVISLIGSGGKSTIMFMIGREIYDSGRRSVITTTTHIHIPEEEFPPLILNEDPQILKEDIRKILNENGQVLAAVSRTDEGKLKGVSPEFIGLLSDMEEVDVILVEADGAKKKSLKGFKDDEPVIPASTTIALAVVGIDAVGIPLTDEYVFRKEIISNMIGLQEGDFITPEILANIILHPSGYIARANPGRSIMIINKVDGFMELQWALEVAQRILKEAEVERVILRGEYLRGELWDLVNQ